MTWEEALKKTEDKTWAFLELMPQGQVITKEQYDYVVEYANHQGLEGYIKPFEEVKEKYIHLGNFFGGARFYITFQDEPDGVVGTEIYKEDVIDTVSKPFTYKQLIGYEQYYKDFTYGKLGRIEFN